MPDHTATARAHPNIAFIKYWGNADPSLNLPANSSLSMNLGGLLTTTTVEYDRALPVDHLTINGQPQTGPAAERVGAFMGHVRRLADMTWHARINSTSNFPVSAGLASSASGYAALALAATAAAGLRLSEKELSVLARLGSGSASRSIPGGFVIWHAAQSHVDSWAESFAPADWWDLQDVIAIIQEHPKETGSSRGHSLAGTSPYQPCRIEGAPRRLEICKNAILERDFTRLAEVIELDSMMMHAVMMTSTPPLLYWHPLTLHILKQAQFWRSEGLQVCATVDAGANPHLICTSHDAAEIQARLAGMDGVQSILVSPAGGPARLV